MAYHSVASIRLLVNGRQILRDEAQDALLVNPKAVSTGAAGAMIARSSQPERMMPAGHEGCTLALLAGAGVCAWAVAKDTTASPSEVASMWWRMRQHAAFQACSQVLPWPYPA